MASNVSTLVLSRAEIAALFTLDEYVDAVEGAFRAHATGRSLPPELLHVDAPLGEFHVKAGGLLGDAGDGGAWFGLKANGGFFRNPSTNGLPGIQGIIYLADAETGSPRAIMDSIHVTIQRTGAATAVAARYLARADASTVTVCGAGRQARVQLRALAAVRPLRAAYVWARSPERAATFADEMRRELGIDVTPVARPEHGTLLSDMVVTCTPARAAFLRAADVRPGTFVAAVGADSPAKQELEPALLARATIVTDLTQQAMHVGELHHAIAAGVRSAGDVHAELGELAAGTTPGRRSDDEIIVFDSTGTALQDVACAAAIYRKAVAAGVGTRVTL